MKDLMLAHIHKYPDMQITDMVKLLYQSEFAGGHMIATPPTRCVAGDPGTTTPTVHTPGAPEFNTAESLARLEAECVALPPIPAGDAFEDIGGGLCRIYLGAMPALSLEPRTVNRLFIATARAVKGSPTQFEKKLNLFLKCCESGELPFDTAEAEAYLRKYRAQGCPPISHSAGYHAAYAPAYRVIKKEYARFIKLFRRIDALPDSKASVSVAVDGNSGAGKSTLSGLLTEVYDCNVFHTDDFFLPAERKTAERLAQPGGNVDYERLRGEVIAGLISGGAFEYRRYDCHSGRLSAPVRATPKRLNIIEGVYSLHPALAMAYDLKVFLKTGGAIQRQRISKRSGEALLKRFADEWIPLENRYFSALRIPEMCDIILDAELMLDEFGGACI